jgi:hypothetical protein
LPPPAKDALFAPKLSAFSEYKEHLFIVHSHITYLVAKRVIEQEGLDVRRVAFLTARGFSTGEPLATVFPVAYHIVPRSRKKRRSIAHAWRALRIIDRFLVSLTHGRRFYLYTPQTMEFFIQILRTSRWCAAFSFIEEGLYSYCTRAEIERIHPPTQPGLCERFAYRNRIRPARFFDTGHAKAYGVSPKVFPDLGHCVVLDNVFPAASQAEAADIQNVIAFDSLSVHKRVRLESVLVALRRVLAHLRSEGATGVHYKFHPAQWGTDEVPAIESLFLKSGIPAKRLRDDLSLESLARARPEIRYFVNLSSVGLYAALFGCPVFSYAAWVAQEESEFATLIQLTPRVFLDSVNLLTG